MLWEPSPQYRNMPDNQYMQTAEGQRARQAFADWDNWQRNNSPRQQQSGTTSSQPAAPASPAVPTGKVPNMSAYAPQPFGQHMYDPGGRFRRPGQATPTPTQGYGIPYGDGSNAAQNDAKWGAGNWAYTRASGGQSPGQQSPPVQPPAWSNPISNSARPSAAQPIPTQSQGTRYGAMPPVDPNVANTPNAPRPQPFSTQVRGFDGQTYSDPAAFFAQRDAFIQRLNEERSRQSVQSGVYGQNERPEFYRPSRDFPTLWGQAGDMIANGWQNPLTQLFGFGDIAREAMHNPGRLTPRR